MDLLVYSAIYGSLISVSTGFLFRNTVKNDTVAKVTTITTAPPPSQDEPFDPVKAEAGAIAGVVFGVLISAIFISIAGIVYIRRKRAHDREFMRRATIQRMSKESAGVYTDTTVDTNFLPTEMNGRDFRYTRKDPNVYEDSSEDEL